VGRRNLRCGIAMYGTTASREEATALTRAFTRFLTEHGLKIRFGAVGIWNTIFGYAVFLGLDTLASVLFGKRYLAYMTAMVLANVIAIMNAFVLHKYVTFKSAAGGRKILIEFSKFCTTYVLTFLLSIILLPVLVELGNLPPKIAAGFLIIACAVISYLGHSRFSFPVSPGNARREGI